MTTVIKVENLSKAYQLGAIGGKTLRDDVSRWLAKLQGKPDPLLKIGQADHGNRAGEIIWALKDVSFEVQEGEVLGIIGRNGAGKSTLLKILSRVTAPTSGVVKVKGRIASLLEVGTGFHPELTGRENIYLNGSILGMRRWEIDKKLDEIVDFSGVEKFIDTPVKRYSSGMYVRLAFAVAAHLDPEILVVDEVLAVGDAEFQKKCLGKMGEVAQGGRTVLFVSHNMAAVTNLCPRSILLVSGHKFFDGGSAETINHYIDQTRVLSASGIENRLDRKGSGIIRFTSIKVCNSDYIETTSIQSGDSIYLDLFYESQQKLLRNVLFEIKGYDSSGILMFTFSTFLKGENFSELPQCGKVTCYCPKLTVTPDVFSLTLICYENGVLADLLTDALNIHVVDGDYYRTGRIVEKRVYGRLLIDHYWSAADVV